MLTIGPITASLIFATLARTIVHIFVVLFMCLSQRLNTWLFVVTLVALTAVSAAGLATLSFSSHAFLYFFAAGYLVTLWYWTRKINHPFWPALAPALLCSTLLLYLFSVVVISTFFPSPRNIVVAYSNMFLLTTCLSVVCDVICIVPFCLLRRTRSTRLANHMCVRCGYPLGSDAHICSECGTPRSCILPSSPGRNEEVTPHNRVATWIAQRKQ